MNGELIPRTALGETDLASMYRLFRSHFDNISEHHFRADLAQKQWIVRIRRGNVLHGFSSLRFIRMRDGGEDLEILYSGDTIVSPEARFSTLFARTWIAGVKELIRYYDVSELHWLLLVSGFRTYRFLPVFWKEFYPCYAWPTPASEQDRMDSIATSLFGEQFHAGTGIVRFTQPQICRADRDGIAGNRFRNPHVEFFVARNPGYTNGDELVCWTRLSEENLTAAGARMWHACEDASPLPLAG